MPTCLLRYLAGALGLDKVTVRDLAAYAMAVAGHSAFTEYFAEELLTPGVRLPLTRDPELWSETVRIGLEFLWRMTNSAGSARSPAATLLGDMRPPCRRALGIGQGTPPYHGARYGRCTAAAVRPSASG